MIIHGIYNNGKIKLLEKSLPQIKTKIKIQIPDKLINKKNKRDAVWDSLSHLIDENQIETGNKTWTRDSLYER